MKKNSQLIKESYDLIDRNPVLMSNQIPMHLMEFWHPNTRDELYKDDGDFNFADYRFQIFLYAYNRGREDRFYLPSNYSEKEALLSKFSTFQVFLAVQILNNFRSFSIDPIEVFNFKKYNNNPIKLQFSEEQYERMKMLGKQYFNYW